jgi:hypothetical protein
MKFGIFYEHQPPRPWTERSEYELLQNSLAQIELADRLGYDYAWRIDLEDLDTAGYTMYAHQNEDIVRLTPEELKRKMAEKEAAQ